MVFVGAVERDAADVLNLANPVALIKRWKNGLKQRGLDRLARISHIRAHEHAEYRGGEHVRL